MIRSLDHYNLRAPRPVMDALRDFYCDVLGLRAGPRPPFERFGYWLYAGDAPVLHLSECDRAEAPADDAGGFDHAAFACVDCAAAERTLKAHGVPYRTARVPGTADVQLFLRDCAGNGVELTFRGEADAGAASLST